jgi:CRISPR/Cas system-associated endonuclease Cas3-HD
MVFYAHSNELDKTKWQTVREHLDNTANIARTLAAGIGLSEFAYPAARLHDIGKYAPEFQKKLDGARLHVDHSTAGAREMLTLFDHNPQQQLIITIFLKKMYFVVFPATRTPYAEENSAARCGNGFLEQETR